MSAQPDQHTNELDKAQVGAIQLVEAREDAAKVLEFVDARFDQTPLAIESDIVGTLQRGALMRRYDHFAALLLEPPIHAIVGQTICLLLKL